MKLPGIKLLLAISTITLCSFEPETKLSSEYSKLQKLERQALRNGVKKEYIFDLTNRKGCNKTSIKYLGIVRTNIGKQYKVLTSFFVFRTGSDMCRGTSRIKIYDIRNRYIGEYYVGMPESLPDTLLNNTLRYLSNSKDCDLRITRSIDLSKGLPKSFFIPCSKNGGAIYSFSNGE
jgi:hypothetical protein